MHNKGEHTNAPQKFMKESDKMLELEENNKLLQELKQKLQELGESL